MLSKLTMDGPGLSRLAKDVATLTGVSVSEARLGIGVFYVDNLAGHDTPKELKRYDNDSKAINKDVESAMWTWVG